MFIQDFLSSVQSELIDLKLDQPAKNYHYCCFKIESSMVIWNEIVLDSDFSVTSDSKYKYI